MKYLNTCIYIYMCVCVCVCVFVCVDLFPYHLGYNNYTDVYFQSSWEDVALEVTVSSVKSTVVTFNKHSG